MFFYFTLRIIYLKLYIILLKYTYISKTTTNLNTNKKINLKINIFKIKNIIVEFKEINGIQYVQMIIKLTIKLQNQLDIKYLKSYV